MVSLTNVVLQRRLCTELSLCSIIGARFGSDLFHLRHQGLFASTRAVYQLPDAPPPEELPPPNPPDEPPPIPLDEEDLVSLAVATSRVA